jgi:predicted ATPase with chaperone activity
MSLSTVNTRAKLGLQAPLVSVEVHLSNGLPAFNIVGLPEAAVKESKDRVRSAIINSKFEFPNRRITVNLAPAELPKTDSYKLSTRSFHRLLKVARSIADLAELQFPDITQYQEALSYRSQFNTH